MTPNVTQVIVVALSDFPRPLSWVLCLLCTFAAPAAAFQFFIQARPLHARYVSLQS